jgi:hypothetical protein
MKKSLWALALVLSSVSPAVAQVRPGACAPVFPLQDQVAVAQLPQDVTVPQAGPTAAAPRRGFFGFPFLPLLLAAGGAGALAAATSGDGGGDTVSPA